MPELKSPRYWSEKGYTFLRHGNCPACHSPVEFWKSPGGSEALLDARWHEPHYASCNNARQYRMEMKLKEGRI